MARTAVIAVTVVTAAVSGPVATSALDHEPHVIADGIDGASGSTIGPDGALYVTEGVTGSVLRVDTENGSTSVFATGLPERVAPIGGPMDVVFRGGEAFVLVSLVGEFFGTDDPSGIYRIDEQGDISLFADLGAWALAHPPGPDINYFITTGVHYSIETYRDGFLVTDAHHNKLLFIDHRGAIEELLALGNVVPTGLETWGSRILVSFTGPAPHVPADGQVMSFRPNRGELDFVASGAALMVDVERGRGKSVFGLSQGYFEPGQDDGSPADPDTGDLVRLETDGSVSVIASGLDRPTSMEIVGSSAFVVGLAGDVVRIDGIG